MNEPDRNRVQEVELLASASFGHDETRLLELPEMLHHAKARHPEPPLERGEGLPIVLEERVEQAPPRGIGHRPEHLVHAQDHR